MKNAHLSLMKIAGMLSIMLLSLAFTGCRDTNSNKAAESDASETNGHTRGTNTPEDNEGSGQADRSDRTGEAGNTSGSK